MDNFSTFSSTTDTCNNEFGNFEAATISSSNLIQNTGASVKDDEFGDFAMQTGSFVPSSDVSALIWQFSIAITCTVPVWLQCIDNL